MSVQPYKTQQTTGKLKHTRKCFTIDCLRQAFGLTVLKFNFSSFCGYYRTGITITTCYSQETPWSWLCVNRIRVLCSGRRRRVSHCRLTAACKLSSSPDPALRSACPGHTPFLDRAETGDVSVRFYGDHNDGYQFLMSCH